MEAGAFSRAAAALLMFSVAAAGAADSGGAADSYVLENEHLRVAGREGCVTEIRVDPAGRGRYGPNWIRSLQPGDAPLSAGAQLRWEIRDKTLTIRNAAVRMARKRGLEGGRQAAPLWPGKRLGQRFRSEWDALTHVGGVFPTWSTRNSGYLLTLRRESPDGEILASRRFENAPDAVEQTLALDPPLPPGFYYLEMSEPVGTPGWYFRREDEKEFAGLDEIGFMTGELGDVKTPAAYDLRARGYDVGLADWRLSLDGSRLRWEVLTTTAPRAQLTTSWIRDGYETDDPERIVFSRFFTDEGVSRPVHQFKRRDSQFLHVPRWLEMTGSAGFNARFAFGGRIDWTMTADRMNWTFPTAEAAVDFLPHTEALSEHYPRFFTSDADLETTLNQFLLSHAFNFGTGVLPDWKEWQSRILCWTKNPQREAEAAHLAGGYRITDEGYVWTWGDSIGWPFPHKDDDGDGQNDYDTRHFTTNPCFILGCANHALWSRDRSFLEKALPRARKAMEFQLKELEGENGIVVLKAEGHQGRPGGIGSNYWDILPFGHKDAFTNTYYYASLEAMARLEELGRKLGIPGEGRAPEFYRELRAKTAGQYREEFWNDRDGRFVGCVDADGKARDYGFTFVNTEAAAYGLPDADQGRRIFRWLDTGLSATGKADIYSRWIFAPRSSTVFNPPHGVYNLRPGLPATPHESWWHFGWHGTDYDEQCQSGGAILYTSFYDVLGRARYVGADDAFSRLKAILDRYSLPDRLSGGSPLYLGETSQGPPAGSVGVESEFPESGLVPCSFLYAFIGVDADAEGLTIRPNLPKGLDYAGVRHLSYGGKTYDVRVTRESVTARCTDPGSTFVLDQKIVPGGQVRLTP